MTKIYIKIFMVFWAINILTVVGHNVYRHWMNPSPEKRLLAEHNEDARSRYAIVGLQRAVEHLLHYDLETLRHTIPTVPEWIFRGIFIVDENGDDLRDREISPVVGNVLANVGPDRPFYVTTEQGQPYAARYILLPEGNAVKMVYFQTPLHARYVHWRLYFQYNWVLYLISLLVSGSACFVVAYYMSRDFRVLQRATQEIARGDLSVRVAPLFASRKDEIAQLGRDFDHMVARLQKSMEEQKRLIKDVSHELRSPLARLQFALGVAQQRSDGGVHTELEKARSAADYLNDIITTILSVPTSDADRWELNDVVELNSLLESLRSEFLEPSQRKGVEITFVSAVREALVATYSNTLIGVFENILGNAVHYTRTNSRISMSLEQEGQGYTVAIADQGPGVREDQLTDIFKPLYRTDEARDRASGGYGLGLSIAQRTVQLHGGSITAHNRPKGGLVVRVKLPAGDFDGASQPVESGTVTA